MPLNHSFGVFPLSRPRRAASEADLLKKRLMWATTAQSEHGPKTLSEADRNENMWHVLEVEHKNTKLRSLPKKEAPLMDRSSGCTHSRDFNVQSYEDFHVNRRMADSMALTLRGKGTVPDVQPWITEPSSSYASSWLGAKGEEMRQAKPRIAGSRRGGITNTLSGTGHSWVTASHMENQNVLPRGALAEGVSGRPDIAWPVHRLRTTGKLGRVAAEDHYRTQFGRDFEPPQSEVEEAEPRVLTLTTLGHLRPTAHSAIFETRRLPCMSIGA